MTTPAPPPSARPDAAALLARLEAFGLSPADDPLVFESRLADDQGWTLGHALAAAAEAPAAAAAAAVATEGRAAR